MHNKNKGIIYAGILILIVCVCTYFVYIKEDDKNETDDKMTLSDSEISHLDDTQKSEQERLLEEREAYRDKCMDICKGEKDYREGKYGVTYNKDFVKEETVFISPDDMIEYEFLDYEVLDNIKVYMEQANKDIEDGKTTQIYYKFDRYINSGHLNEDGTFISQKHVFYKKEEEQKADEYTDVVAIKITMRYKNLSAKENEFCYVDFHNLNSFVYADDNELYPISSVYRRSWLYETSLPVYTTMAERYVIVESSQTGKDIKYSCIKLEPFEEYTAELIYIVPEAELDNVAFTSGYALNGDSSNYKDIGTNIVFASYLKEKFDK